MFYYALAVVGWGVFVLLACLMALLVTVGMAFGKQRSEAVTALIMLVLGPGKWVMREGRIDVLIGVSWAVWTLAGAIVLYPLLRNAG